MQTRLDRGILKPSYSAYRNPQFLVKKKDSTHQHINSAIYLNKVTIRDALVPPNVDEFAKGIAGQLLCSLVDIFLGNNNVTLHLDSQDITAIITLLGLLR